MVIGDSSIRAFGRTRKSLNATSVTGFGGMDVLELIGLLQVGKVTKDFDLGKYKIRNRLQYGKDEFATIKFCKHCYSECTINFTGQLILVIGLNNSLKAEREPFSNEYGRSMQDINAIYNLLDKTLSKMVPNASVLHAPVLKVVKGVWKRSQIAQKIYGDLNACIYRRPHLQFDPEEPLKNDLFDREGVHLEDNAATEFWAKSFEASDE